MHGEGSLSKAGAARPYLALFAGLRPASRLEEVLARRPVRNQRSEPITGKANHEYPERLCEAGEMVRARNTDDSRYKEEQCKDPNPYNCDLPLSRHDRICTFSCCPYQHYSPLYLGPRDTDAISNLALISSFPRDP